MKRSYRPASPAFRPMPVTRVGMAALLTALAGIQPTTAELPGLTDKTWLGQFAVYKNRSYQLTISNQGEISLAPYGRDGEIIGSYIVIPIAIGIEEVLPDGKTQWYPLLPESLESSDKAAEKLKKTVIRGKVNGGASFEATIEEARDAIHIGGRITETGTVAKNPLHFRIRATIPYFYGHVEKDTPEQKSEFEATIKSDYVETKWIDGKRHKELFTTPVDACSPEFTGPGIAAAEIGITPFQTKKLLMTASADSSMKFANTNRAPTAGGSPARPLYEGIIITWTADLAKDPHGKARLAFQFK